MKKTPIVYDTQLFRPACVLLQAALGGTPSVAHLFPSETWLVHPTPDMTLYEATDEQLENLVQVTKRVNKL